MKKSILLALLAVSLPFSCKKEDNANKTKLLTAHCWVLNEATIAPAAVINGVPVTDFYALMSLCERDNVTCLLENGNVYVDEGASKCDPNDPQVNTSGTWWFNSDESVLLAFTDTNPDTIHSELLELSANRLRIRQNVEILGQSSQVTFTYQPE